MEPLFRFVMVRPVETATPEVMTVPTNPSHEALAAINAAYSAGRDAPSALRSAGARLLSASLSPAAEADAKLSNAAADFASRISATMTVEQARTAAAEIFGASAAEVVASPAYAATARRLSDALLALKYLGRHEPTADDVLARYRALAYLGQLASTTKDDALPAPASYMDRIVSIAGVEPGSAPNLAPRASVPKPSPTERTAGAIEGLRARADALRSAIRELLELPPRLLQVDTSTAAVAQASVPVVSRSSDVRAAAPVGERMTSAPATPAAAVAPSKARADLARPIARGRLMATAGAIEALPRTARKAIEHEGIALERIAVPDAVSQLDRTLGDVGLELIGRENATNKPVKAVRIGSGIYEITLSALDLGPLTTAEPSVPATHGELKPVGVGDLMVVKQHLKRYEAHDLSNVVNVLKGEHRSTETKRTLSEQTTATTETTTTTEQERDQQTTQRFEMQTETSNVQKQDQSLKLGASVSASYGPFVTFKAGADSATSTTREESSKIACRYSKDVTDRASSKITQTVRELRSTTMMETFSETHVHEWNNVGGTGHVVGQYQWLDKIYEAQVYNYGKRVLFDATVPEPGAFLQFVLEKGPKPGSTITKPRDLTITPRDLDPKSYGEYVRQYDAAGIDAPPEPYVRVGKTFDGSAEADTGGAMSKTAEIAIPEGYKAISADVFVDLSYWSEGEVLVRVAVGAFWGDWTGIADVKRFPLDGEVGTIPLVLSTWKTYTFVASVEITCARTDRALEAWQLKTYAAIKQGYDKQLRDYNEQLAAAQDAAEGARGMSPDVNARLVRDELKRLFITLFTRQHFDSFGAIAPGPFSYPQMDIATAEAQGSYIRFMEEAFEWEEMVYLFYPYYWRHKSSWFQWAAFDDDDPQFAAFLKAGAARVVISVRPGLERAVAHFLETGQIWNGGDPPDIASEAYVSIVAEIKDQQGAPGGEVPQGDPWEVRVPTTLVVLRQEDGLPAWKKGEDGEWKDA